MTDTFTPEQVAQWIPVFSAWWIREQCRRGRIEHLRGAKGRIAFTEAQVQALVDYATRPATPRPVGLASLTTVRSARRRTA